MARCGLWIALLAVVSSDVKASIDIEQNHDQVTVKEGDEFVLLCSANMEVKACSYRDPSGETLHLFEGAEYEGRIFSHRKNPKDCGIRVSDATEKDNGNWECTISATLPEGSAVKGSRSAQVTVEVPPSAVQLRIGDQLALTQYQIQMVNGVNPGIPVDCIARGARPAPRFKWYLGHDELNGQDEEGPVEETGDGKASYTRTLQYYPNSMHNGHVLSCVVEHDAYTAAEIENKVNEADVTLNILFPPSPPTKDLVFYDLNEGKSNTIRMKFSANPMPQEGVWLLDGREDPLAVGSETLDMKYKSGFYEEGDVPGEWTVSLTIENMQAEEAGKRNGLMITNEAGSQEYGFRLEVGSQPPPGGFSSVAVPKGGGSANGLAIGLIVLSLVVIGLVVLGIVARAKGVLCFGGSKGGEEHDEEKEAFESAEKGESKVVVKDAKAPAAGGDTVVKKASPEKKPEVKAEEQATTAKRLDGDGEEKKSNGARTPV